MSKYVQHISGQGEKWEISHDTAIRWICKPPNSGQWWLDAVYLPKSEYREVPAPEVWKDVTEACIEGCVTKDFHAELSHQHEKGYSSFAVVKRDDYRLRKVQFDTLVPNRIFSSDTPPLTKSVWAFIVEKKQ